MIVAMLLGIGVGNGVSVLTANIPENGISTWPADRCHATPFHAHVTWPFVTIVWTLVLLEKLIFIAQPTGQIHRR